MGIRKLLTEVQESCPHIHLTSCRVILTLPSEPFLLFVHVEIRYPLIRYVVNLARNLPFRVVLLKKGKRQVATYHRPKLEASLLGELGSFYFYKDHLNDQ